MKTPVRKRKTKTDLLEKGLEILGEQGVAGLTIDTLCTGLGVTKGSFYHHFTGRASYHAELLEFWMHEHTENKKALADMEGTPLEKYARIVAYAATRPFQIEKVIRAWAMRDPLAASYQAKVDASRKNYLKGLLEELLHDARKAELYATIIYSTMIGSRHLFPPVLGDARTDIMQELHALMGVRLPTQDDS